MIDVDVFKETRASYGQEIVATLSRQLTHQCWCGFDRMRISELIVRVSTVAV